MNRAGKYGIVLAIFFAVLVLLSVAWTLMSQKSRWEFTEDSRTLNNPDRGFYIQVDSGNPERISDAAGEVRLILLAFDMEGYTDGDLPEEKLKELQTALDTAKTECVSVIFRAAYGFCKDVSEPEEITQMGRHIEQISTVLNRYPRQIFVVQAGMLGAYGEWHSSIFLEGEKAEAENRLYILKQWEKYLDPQIKAAVRRPRFIREAEEAGVMTGRLGLHNDALLSTDDDMGTYDVPGFGREEELAWTDENLLGQVNGGEMPTPGKRNLPEHAEKEFQKLHLRYLNLKYNEEILAQWEQTEYRGINAKQYLERHLGYRLFLSELTMNKAYFGKSILKNGIEIEFSLCNSGYAPLPAGYRLFFIVSSGKNQIRQEVQAQGLYQISGKETMSGNFLLEIPQDFLQGEEEILLGMKIAWDGNETDERNCVELAGQNRLYEDGVNWFASLVPVAKFFYETKTE